MQNLQIKIFLWQMFNDMQDYIILRTHWSVVSVGVQFFKERYFFCTANACYGRRGLQRTHLERCVHSGVGPTSFHSCFNCVCLLPVPLLHVLNV